MKNIDKQIGKRLASKRKALKLTQEELAEIAEMHPAYISNIERGVNSVSIKNIQKVAIALQLPLETLFKNL